MTGPETGRDLAAADVRELLGVHSYAQAQPIRSLEQDDRLFGAESNVFDENIDGIHQPLAVQLRQPLARHRIDVIGRPASEFGWQCVRRQERGADPDSERLTQLARHPQHPPFIRQGQAIAGLDLHRGHTFGRQGGQPGCALREQLLLAGKARIAHGVEDAAALVRDLFIGNPAQPLRILGGAGAGKDQVGMAIDQPGRDPGTAQVMDRVAYAAQGLRADPAPARPRSGARHR